MIFLAFNHTKYKYIILIFFLTCFNNHRILRLDEERFEMFLIANGLRNIHVEEAFN
jgi:hypothetical protein